MPIITRIGVDFQMKRVALYIRVSHDKQVQHGDSLREQHDTLNDYAKQHKYKIVGEYVDGGISGQKLSRDGFNKLMDDVREDKIDIILFTKIDRWFRKLRHYLNTQEVLEQHNVSWLAVSQPYFDTSTAQGRTFINNSMAFAELEAQMTSERILAVNASKIAKGEVVSGAVPFGYKIENKHLVATDQSEIIVDMFDYYIISGSIRATVKHLENVHGILRDYQSIRKWLTNTKYIGLFRDNDSYCPAIIDKETFYTVQNMLKKNKKNNTRHSYIFRGLIKCAHCGGMASSGHVESKHIKKNGEISIYTRQMYRCAKAKNNKSKCHNTKTYQENILEERVLDLIQDTLKQKTVIFETQKQKAARNKSIKAKLENKLERLKKAYLNEVIELDEYKKDRESIMNELEQLQIPKISNKKSIEFVLSDEFQVRYKKASSDEKNAIWRSIIDKILIYDNSNIEIVLLQ